MQAATTRFAPPATGRLATRYLWKEGRRLRGLSLGVAGMTLLAQLVAKLATPAGAAPGVMLILAFGGAVLLAVAAAVTLFAVETEEGTATGLLTLPTNRPAVLLGKVVAAVVAVAATLALLGLTGYALAGAWPINASVIVAQGSMAIAEAFVWTLLASLLCPNPLVAAVLGMAAASMNSQVAMLLTHPSSRGFTGNEFQAALPVRAGLAALVAGADVWLGLRWPRRESPAKPPRGKPFSRSKLRDAAPFDAASAPTAERSLRRGWFAGLWRLLWQTVRQSWLTGLAVVLLGLFLTGACALIVNVALQSAESWQFAGALGLLFMPALLGAVVFREDQRRRQHRFLSEHAGRPRLTWLARNGVWLTLGLVVVGSVLGVIGYLLATQTTNFVMHEILEGRRSTAGASGLWEVQQSYGWVVLGLQVVSYSVLAAYAVGQFCSLAIRSDVLAGLVSLIASVALTAWAMVVLVWRLPPLWFVAPLAVGALLASWLRAPDWMFERGGVARWIAPVAALLAPIGLIAAWTPQARLDQLQSDYYSRRDLELLGFDFDAMVSEAEREFARGDEVADAYRRIASQAENVGPDNPFGGALLEEVTELSRVDCRFPPRFMNVDDGLWTKVINGWHAVYGYSEDAGGEPGFGGGEYLGGAVPQLVAPGEPTQGGTIGLDERLERLLTAVRLTAQWLRGQTYSSHSFAVSPPELLDWATAEGQTPDRLREAIRRLEAIEARRATPSDWQVNDYLHARSVVRGEQAPRFLLEKDVSTRSDDWLPYLANELPWERRRSERAVKLLAAARVELMFLLEAGIDPPDETTAARWREQLRDSTYRYENDLAAILAMSGQPPNYHALLGGAALITEAQTSHLAAKELGRPYYLLRSAVDWVKRVAWRRAERVRLALIAYRLEHGAYPERLEQLTPDFLQPAQYQDPYTAGPFGYEPEGYDLRAWQPRYDLPREEDKLAPGTPLLWCTGGGAAEPRSGVIIIEIESDGRRIENLVRGDPPPESDATEEVMRLAMPKGSWGSGEFWMALPE